MKSSSFFLVFLMLLSIAGCGGGGGSGSDGTPDAPPSPGQADSLPVSQGTNVLRVTVNGSLCSRNSYLNKPCVAVTICSPGSQTCQTIDDIVLDTGSYGLRIFKEVISVPLTQVTVDSAPLAECVQFGDGSSEWGPVQIADVILGTEPAVQVPIQVIDSTFFGQARPAFCSNADPSPASAGFNGILGVGFFREDCGPACVTRRPGFYYRCSDSDCPGTTVPLSSQVQNPVHLLPINNNGLIVQLPAVPQGGAMSADGYAILGIGTQSNNLPAGVVVYRASNFGELTTNFNGATYDSFLDTGSNGLFFPGSNILPSCTLNPAWFCPPSNTALSATNIGAQGTPAGDVSFEIGNLQELVASGNRVFANIGGDLPSEFIWGLPFYLGRTVYQGLEGKTSPLGSGLYWAY